MAECAEVEVVEFDCENCGYNHTIDGVRKREFARLGDITYLDHAGTTLYAQSQLDNYYKDLSDNVYGNPHSHNASSQLTTDTIEQIRYRVLKHFNTTPENHTVIFTSGCTASLKLLAESFDWYGGNGVAIDSSYFCYLEDNHTSVVGMREIAAENGAQILCLSLEEFTSSIQLRSLPSTPKTANCLFAYAAQCNFSGRRNPLEWADSVKSQQFQPGNCYHGKWYVALDAASHVTTAFLDLSSCRADFVTISFYKMFGLPTGLGALIVRNDVAHLLKKTYFGGGTVLVSINKERFHVPRPSLHERFEDGTVSFLDIISLKHGFDAFTRLAGDMNAVAKHTFSLASFVFHKMASYRHGNGAPAVKLYNDTEFDDNTTQGPIVNFNILKPNGSYVGFAEVDKLASLHQIHVRTGCFCNAGACGRFLDLSTQQLKENFEAGHVCGDNFDLVDGLPTGSVRISFGYMSTYQDIKTFLDFIVECFVVEACQNVPHQSHYESTISHHSSQIIKQTLVTMATINKKEELSRREFDHPVPGRNEKLMSSANDVIEGTQVIDNKQCKRKLRGIFLYPVKSCGAMEVTNWPVSACGLLFDRTWMIVNQNGVFLSQKRVIRLCLIKPRVDLEEQQLILHADGFDDIMVPLYAHCHQNTKDLSACRSKVCGDRIHGTDCGDKAAEWLTLVVGLTCRLVRQDTEHDRVSKLKSMVDNHDHRLSLSNESQFLLINTISVKHLQQKIKERQITVDADVDSSNCLATDEDAENLIGRFRGNLIIDGEKAYEEDNWSTLRIGDLLLKSGGPCSRCQMVCINQMTAERSKEPLTTLATYRNRKVPFGIHLFHDREYSGTTWIQIGDAVTPLG